MKSRPTKPQIKDHFRFQNGRIQKYHERQKTWIDVDLNKRNQRLTFGHPRRFVDPGLVVYTLYCNGVEPEGKLVHLNGDRCDHRLENLAAVPPLPHRRKTEGADDEIVLDTSKQKKDME